VAAYQRVGDILTAARMETLIVERPELPRPRLMTHFERGIGRKRLLIHGLCGSRRSWDTTLNADR
jgi:hypothetical protein